MTNSIPDVDGLVGELRSWPAVTQGDALSASVVALLMERSATALLTLSSEIERKDEALIDILRLGIAGLEVFRDDVREPLSDGFARTHKRFRVHQLLDGLAIDAGAGRIDIDDGGIEALEELRGIGHVMAIADHHPPGIVHHHEGAEAHANFVAGHGND